MNQRVCLGYYDAKTIYEEERLTSLGPRQGSLKFPICNPVLHYVSVALKLSISRHFFFLTLLKIQSVKQRRKKHPPWLRHSRGHRIFKLSEFGASCPSTSQCRTDFQLRICSIPFMPFIKVFLHDSNFSFLLSWPVSYLAALSPKYSLVKLEFNQMPSYLKWLGEYSDHLSMSPSELLLRQTCAHYLRQKMNSFSCYGYNQGMG